MVDYIRLKFLTVQIDDWFRETPVSVQPLEQRWLHHLDRIAVRYRYNEQSELNSEFERIEVCFFLILLFHFSNFLNDQLFDK